jgi:hypothetical protein
MKIGLLDIDGRNFPNLALMKISSFHKAKGDDVEWINHFNHYDKAYLSKIFTFSPNNYHYIHSNEIVMGGTGYDISIKLPGEIDDSLPDYSLYPKFKHAYGFLTRGCNNKCSWCVVPEKEGKLKPYNDIEEIIQDRKTAILMDNNILGSDYGLQQIEKIIELRIKVDFNQGLDARLITPEIAELLSKVRWIDKIRLACDSDNMVGPVIKAMQLLGKHNIKPWKFTNYLLLNGDIKSAYSRAIEMKKFGARISPQPYRDFKNTNIIPQWQKDFAQWGYKKQLYNAVDFKDFEVRKGFFCREHF